MSATLCADSAWGAEALKFAAPPPWVIDRPIRSAAPKQADAPSLLLQRDDQIRIEGGTISRYSKSALKILKSDGLAAGNLSLAWNPAIDELTVHRLEIRRGDQIIDVLQSGQTFTTMRRESNLEKAMLDGVLTANIQPEGLQEGDILILSATQVTRDPVMNGHVETVFASWGDVTVADIAVRLTHPKNMNLRVESLFGLPATTPSIEGSDKVFQVAVRDLEPMVFPANAPSRFRMGRIGEATDFQSWKNVAELLAPLFQKALLIPPNGQLRAEVDKIRTASMDPKVRAQAALQLVQNKIRYVALALGQGTYVPASPVETWARRFGDCKAKTALLLAMLNELGVAAHPVVVNSVIGDSLPLQLPMVGLFDHVLVRATIGGRDYWLDGTRSGDDAIDEIPVPNFHWGLPLLPNASLVPMMPRPLTVPASELTMTIDASAGARAPAKVSASQLLKGDEGIVLSRLVGTFSTEQRNAFLTAYWKSEVDFVSPSSLTYSYDERSHSVRLAMVGTGAIHWDGSKFWIPQTGLAFKPDFERKAGTNRDAPISVPYPAFASRTVTIQMPKGFFNGRPPGVSPAVDQKLAGIEYRRTLERKGETVTIATSERSVVDEVPLALARADEAKIHRLNDDNVALTLPAGYRETTADLDTLKTSEPTSKAEYFDRGVAFLNSNEFAKAISDLDQAIDPSDPYPYANRALALIYVGKFDAGRRDIAAAAALDPHNYIMLHARGLLAEKEQRDAEALAAYTEAAARPEGDPWALGQRASLKYRLGKRDEALADSARVIEAEPASVAMRLLRANIFVARGKTELAAKEADSLLAQNSDAYSLVVAARVLARVGQRPRALQLFERALTIEPSSLVYLNRAQIRLPSEAALRTQDIAAAAKLDPTDTSVLAEQAEDHLRNRRYTVAVDQFRAIVKSDKDESGVLRTQLGIALSKSGQEKEARELLSRVRAQLKDAVGHNRFCWDLATRNVAIDLALDSCREAVRREPGSAPNIDSLAFTEFRAGHYAAALADYDKAIALRPDQAESVMGRAFVHAKLDHAAESAADAARAMKLDATIADQFAEYDLKL